MTMGGDATSNRGIADFPKPATHDGVLGHVKDEPLHLVFHHVGGGTCCPTFRATASIHYSASLLKSQVRLMCKTLSEVPNTRLRLLYRGVELPDDSPVIEHLASVKDERPIHLQFL